MDDALSNADSANNLRLRIKLAEGNAVPSVEDAKKASTTASNTDSGFGELSLEAIEEPAEEPPTGNPFMPKQ
jgi:hypothetical protein